MGNFNKSLEEYCIENNLMDFVKFWDYELNGIAPSEISCLSSGQGYFVCPQGKHKSFKRGISSIGMGRTKHLKCPECQKLGFYRPKVNWKFKIGQRIVDDCGRKRGITITNRKTVNTGVRSEKYYQFKCNICGYDYGMDSSWVSENSLASKHANCPCCGNRKIVKGINDITTLAPWMIRYFTNPDDAVGLARTSHKKFSFTCPDCGSIRIDRPVNIYANGFSCPCCSDGVSYPEKFFKFLLDKNKINYVYQLNKSTFPWCQSYKYDFYLPDYNYIVELHGEQHYLEKSVGWGSSLEEIQTNDKNKYELAIKNDIDKYIVIDCRDSLPDFIYKNILKSDIGDLFKTEFSELAKIDEKARGSLLIDVCKKYMENYPKYADTLTLSNIFKISRKSVTDYLLSGAKLGLCDYDSSNIMKETCRKRLSTPIKVTDYETGKIYYFDNKKRAKKESREIVGKTFSDKSIYKHIDKDTVSYNGLKFETLSLVEFNKLVDDNIPNVFGEKFVLKEA